MFNDATYFLLCSQKSYKFTKTNTNIVKTNKNNIIGVFPQNIYPFEYDGVQFFGHKKCSVLENGAIFSDDNWGVTEKSTGLGLVSGFRTLREAILKAREQIAKDGIEKYHKALQLNRVSIIREICIEKSTIFE